MPPASPHSQNRKLLLIGIDGADWNLIRPLIDNGELPAFTHLVENGTMGNLATLSPTLSPVLWTSIATGKRAGLHGIHGFTEIDPTTNRVRPVSSVSRKCKAVWNILQQNDKTVNLSNWFASHPAEPLNGIALSDFFPSPGPANATEPPPVPDASVHPWDKAEHFGDMRVIFDDIDSSIGDLFIKDLEGADEKKDQRITQLGMQLAESYTLQGTTLDILENHPWDFHAVYFRVVDILCHIFMPFHPPQMEGVPDELFEHYSDTINSAYRFIDLLLSFQLAKAGPDATVMILSDHGFLHDHLRPRPNLQNAFADPEGWHRDHGIILVKGPGVKKDHLIHGAGLLDITPTILSLFGLPLGKDMQGRALTAIFEEEPEIEYIDSWENVPGEDGRHPDGSTMGDADAKELLDRFVELGYIAPLGDNAQQNNDQTLIQNGWNLARDFMDYGAWEDALPHLETLHHKAPGNPSFTVQLAYCQWRLGLAAEAERTLGDALRMAHEGPMLSLLRGHLALERDDEKEALTHYEAAAELVQNNREIHLAIGRAWLRLNKLEEAEAAFRKVLELEPENAFAFQGLARTHLIAERWEDAAHAAIDAVALQHNLPTAHAVLGDALINLNQFEEAKNAYERCITYDGTRTGVMLKLATLAREKFNDSHGALSWRTRAERVQQETPPDTDRLDRLRTEAEDRRLAREQEAVWGETETPEQLAEQQAKHREQVAAAMAPPEQPAERLEPGQEFVIVSGLPRSGTSLMMQMLKAGGLDLQTDDERPADEHNPEGYFEWDDIKKLAENPLLIERAHGKVTKVVSPLLRYLPTHHQYKVIHMERPPVEVEASQRKMVLAESGNGDAPDPEKPVDSDQIQAALDLLRTQTRDLLEKADRFTHVSVSYPDLLANPEATIASLAKFLSTDLDPAAMATAIKPELHREKAR